MKKIATALLGLLLLALFVLLYLKYDIIALIRLGWKTLLGWIGKFFSMLARFIAKHTPALIKRLLWKRLWKPLWSFLTITALAILGPQWVARIKSQKKQIKHTAKQWSRRWRMLPWYVQGAALALFAGILYLLGVGVLVPIFGISLVIAGVKRLWVTLTDWYLEAKTKQLRQRAIRKLKKRSALFAHSHSSWRRLRISYRWWIKKRRRKWWQSGKLSG